MFNVCRNWQWKNCTKCIEYLQVTLILMAIKGALGLYDNIDCNMEDAGRYMLAIKGA